MAPTRGVSAELFDLELHKPSEPAAVEIKRLKLSLDGKTLELASDAEGNPEPTIEVLELIDATTPVAQTCDRTCRGKTNTKDQ